MKSRSIIQRLRIAGSLLIPLFFICGITCSPRQTSTIKFNQGRQAMNIPITIYNNLIFVECRVNNSATGTFIFDTGAAMTILDSAFAAANNIDASSKIRSVVSGQEYPAVNDMIWTFKGVQALGINARVFNTAQLSSVIGHAIDGIIGYDLLDKFVVVIDYSRSEISFHDPVGYQYNGQGEKVQLYVEGKWPLVNVTLEQKNKKADGKLILDTGSLTALSLNRDELSDTTVPFPISFGISGSGGGSKFGRLSSISIGRHKISHPVAGFPAGTVDTSDPLAKRINELSMGLIGSELLKKFTVTLDYAHKHAYFEQNADFDDAVIFDMSGLTIITTDSEYKQFMIIALIPQSPAEIAGLQAGDMIAEINDTPAAQYNLAQIRELFKIENTVYKLKIKRNEEIKEIEFKTKKLI